MEQELVTAKEVIQMLHVSPSTLQRLEREKLLVPCMKLPSNNKRFYKLDEVVAYENSIVHNTDVDNLVEEDALNV